MFHRGIRTGENKCRSSTTIGITPLYKRKMEPGKASSSHSGQLKGDKISFATSSRETFGAMNT